VSLTAKSFVLDLLSTLRGGTMPVRALIAAADHFDIQENNLRVALARLLAAGQLERDERGQYGLGKRAVAIRSHVTAWSSIPERTVAWDGSWVGVQRGRVAATLAERRRHERALHFFGFQSLVSGLDVRPNNLRGGVVEVRQRLQVLGLGTTALVFELHQFDTATEKRARGLWNVTQLRHGYQRALADLATSTRRLSGLSETAAMIESFRVGGSIIRLLVVDPLLPEPIIPESERVAVVEALRRYDKLGRACWSRFMRDVGAPHLQAPADTRMGHTREQLRPVAMG
jgi:phenylacetic acid degradation operon negative regulatory protein